MKTSQTQTSGLPKAEADGRNLAGDWNQRVREEGVGIEQINERRDHVGEGE